LPHMRRIGGTALMEGVVEASGHEEKPARTDDELKVDAPAELPADTRECTRFDGAASIGGFALAVGTERREWNPTALTNGVEFRYCADFSSPERMAKRTRSERWCRSSLRMRRER
jgi:hypothetical protein